MEAPDPEGQLIARVASGDRDAFAQLVDRTGDGLFRYLRSLVRSDEAAEDALQEVLVGVWRGARSWRGETAGRVWLYGIARRQAARTWRRRAGESVASMPMEELARCAGFGDGMGPERIMLDLETHDRVHAALDRLSDDDRDVVALRDLEGFSAAEAAELLGIEVGAVKSRLHRARLRLMAELRGVGGSDGE